MKRSSPEDGEVQNHVLPDEEHLDGLRLDAGRFIAGLPEVMEKWSAAGLGTSDATQEQHLERTATWYGRLKELQAEPERGEVRIPGVPRRGLLQNPKRKKPATFADVVGKEKAFQYAKEKAEHDARVYKRRQHLPPQ